MSESNYSYIGSNCNAHGCVQLLIENRLPINLLIVEVAIGWCARLIVGFRSVLRYRLVHKWACVHILAIYNISVCTSCWTNSHVQY